MKFCDLSYKRIPYEDIVSKSRELTEKLRTAACTDDCIRILGEWNHLQDELTPMELCAVRHDGNVNDPIYAGEQAWYDQIGPELSGLSRAFHRELLSSRFRCSLESLIGTQAFTLFEQEQLTFSEPLIPLMQEENSLVERYSQITSNLTVNWDGKHIKATLMAPYTQSSDRDTRKRSYFALAKAWEAHQDELGMLYVQLAANRSRQATLMGFSDYGCMSYPLMSRVGYTKEEVVRFCGAVKRYLAPLFQKIEEHRRIRLGLDQLYPYDHRIFFPEGNPLPPQDTAACLAAARSMYTQMSPETADFIAHLLDDGFYDVEIRDGKRGGGYMAWFAKYRMPYIFANFDGTIENAYILCHEGGHAFQAYLQRQEPYRERCLCTSETAETHAMAMEFFAYPYLELFFGRRTEDYKTMHQEDAVRLILSECLLDEFQQHVYEQPGLSCQELNRLWQSLEHQYFPGRTEKEGGLPDIGWQRIPHLYQWPFYAIDYALAQVCAFGYLRWMEISPEGAWQSYLSFCRESGSSSFPQLAQNAGLWDPFDSETIRILASWLDARLCGSHAI